MASYLYKYYRDNKTIYYLDGKEKYITEEDARLLLDLVEVVIINILMNISENQQEYQDLDLIISTVKIYLLENNNNDDNMYLKKCNDIIRKSNFLKFYDHDQHSELLPGFGIFISRDRIYISAGRDNINNREIIIFDTGGPSYKQNNCDDPR